MSLKLCKLEHRNGKIKNNLRLYINELIKLNYDDGEILDILKRYSGGNTVELHERNFKIFYELLFVKDEPIKHIAIRYGLSVEGVRYNMGRCARKLHWYVFDKGKGSVINRLYTKLGVNIYDNREMNLSIYSSNKKYINNLFKDKDVNLLKNCFNTIIDGFDEYNKQKKYSDTLKHSGNIRFMSRNIIQLGISEKIYNTVELVNDLSQYEDIEFENNILTIAKFTPGPFVLKGIFSILRKYIKPSDEVVTLYSLSPHVNIYSYKNEIMRGYYLRSKFDSNVIIYHIDDLILNDNILKYKRVIGCLNNPCTCDHETYIKQLIKKFIGGI